MLSRPSHGCDVVACYAHGIECLHKDEPGAAHPASRSARRGARGERGEGLTLMVPLIVSLTLLAQAVVASALPSVTLPPELARVLTEYESAWQQKDARALAELFAEDGFVLSSGVPPVRGRQAIQKHYSGQGGPLSLRALAYTVEGSTGYIIGGFARQTGQPDIGKFTLTLRKSADGRWLIMSDMDNGNSRP
jgi:ketosteroid isomerase-like protein